VGTLQNNGCKQKVEEIEDFLYDYGDRTLYEWYRDLQDPKIANFTYNYIEELLNHKFYTSKVTPPINNAKREIPTSSHENGTKEIPIDKTEDQYQEYTTNLLPSNINYYDLSPYVNTVEVFQRNIAQLKEEITRILCESGITEPLLLETTLNKELTALTGNDPRKFSTPTKTDLTSRAGKLTNSEIKTSSKSSEPTSSAPTLTPTLTPTAFPTHIVAIASSAQIPRQGRPTVRIEFCSYRRVAFTAVSFTTIIGGTKHENKWHLFS
jgi:hypothetical protein